MDKVYTPMGLKNNTTCDRQEDDFYATDPLAVKLLLEIEKFDGEIWECACGDGRLSQEIKKTHKCFSSDKFNRGYGQQIDFFDIKYSERNIITNPPYKLANAWIIHGNNIMRENNKMALFMPLRYLEGKARREIYNKFPPKVVYVSTGRIGIYKNGVNVCGNAMAFAWYVWEKNYKGETILKWFNYEKEKTHKEKVKIKSKNCRNYTQKTFEGMGD